MKAFGQPVNTYYDLTKADIVVALDADFLSVGAGNLRYARQFASRRRVSAEKTTMNRLYVVEPMPTATGAKAGPSPAAARGRHRRVFLGAGHRHPDCQRC
ncbi:MAG: hypothetical protein WDO73_27200 [Ignavibacteriota bacterium]